MTDIEKLLEGRKVVDVYRGAHAGLHTSDHQEKEVAHEQIEGQLAQGLEKLGFTIDEFFALNKRMVLETFKEYRPFYGQCDFCEGYEGTPPCLTLYGEGSCYYTKKLATKEQAAGVQFQRYQQGIHDWSVANLKKDILGDKYYSFCPPGHGYYGLLAELREFPFDMSWR